MNNITPSSSYLTFAIGRHAYGLPLTRVREIVACHSVARFPGAGEGLRGLMSLRGNVVPVIDLARFLGVGDTPLSDTSCAVMIETDIDGENSSVGGLVEEIQDVIDVSAEELAATPDFGTPVDPRLLSGVTLQERGFVYVLDLDAILDSLDV